MALFVDAMLAAVILPLVLWAAWLLLTVAVGAVTPTGAGVGADGPRAGPVAVLVPAHDEEAGIAATLASVLPQLEAGDRIMVVADNCCDRTADVAARALASAPSGVTADVARRVDEARRGKPWALAFGLERLATDPPAAVLVIDADCRLADGGIDALRRATGASRRAAQALNLLDPPADAGPRQRLSAFAFAVKNRSRLRGTRALRVPSHLLGTGMLVPWEDTAIMRAGGDDLAEDMSLGAALVAAGRGAQLVEAAIVRSPAASGDAATHGQRTRWERGHLEAIRSEVPRLVAAAVRRGDPRPLAFALDLSVPPLALLVGALVGAAAIGAIGFLLGVAGPLAAVAAVGGLLAVATAVLLAATTTARGYIGPGDLLRTPVYVAWKIPIYAGFVLRRRIAWRRTERDGTGGPSGVQPASEGRR